MCSCKERLTSQSEQIGSMRLKLLHWAAYIAASYLLVPCSAILFRQEETTSRSTKTKIAHAIKKQKAAERK